TFSKVIDVQSSDFGTSFTPTTSQNTDINNLRRDRAAANFDRKHVFITTWIYELPFGQGHKWMGKTSSIVDRVFGGWSIQGFNSMMSGVPFSVSSGVKTANFGSNSRAVLAPGVTSLPDTSLKTKTGQIGPVFFPDA